MKRLKPEKLHVTYLNDTDPEKLILPRYYTMTHSDLTANLYLSIGREYQIKQISGWYTRWMRDEVLARIVSDEDGMVLRVYCHVCGGFIFGIAKSRYMIFKHELQMVLEVFRYGDRCLFEKNPQLDSIPIMVHFSYNNGQSEKVENWGIPADYQ